METGKPHSGKLIVCRTGYKNLSSQGCCPDSEVQLDSVSDRNSHNIHQWCICGSKSSFCIQTLPLLPLSSSSQLLISPLFSCGCWSVATEQRKTIKAQCEMDAHWWHHKLTQIFRIIYWYSFMKAIMHQKEQPMPGHEGNNHGPIHAVLL